MLYTFVTKLNNFFSYFCSKNTFTLRHTFLNVVNWLPLYFNRSHKLWQEGLYSDHLQKKVLDKFVRKVIIFSNNLFGENLYFRRVVDAYWVLITSPTFLKLISPFNSPVFNFVWFICFLFTLLFLIIIYGYIFLQYLPNIKLL